MSPFRLALMAAFTLPALAGCAVVDLAAHGMKEFEKSKVEAARSTPAATEPAPMRTPVSAPSARPAPEPSGSTYRPVNAREASEPAPAVPPRESVSVETLR